MAMKACKECGREISTEAKVCPHCGKKNPTGGWTLGAKLGLVLLVIVAYQSLNRSSNVSSSPSATVAQSVATAGSLMPSTEEAFFAAFAAACSRYKRQPNEIKKSAVYRASRSLLSDPPRIASWTGRLSRISTNQGGSNATLVIRAGESKFYDDDVPLGSPIYNAAGGMAEGQMVTFSATNLRDFNLTEEGKICSPDFRIRLTGLR